jgi:hypothetical protein
MATNATPPTDAEMTGTISAFTESHAFGWHFVHAI